VKLKRYSEEQIIKIPKEHEAGALVPDLARPYGIVETTIYRWKTKFGGGAGQLLHIFRPKVAGHDLHA